MANVNTTYETSAAKRFTAPAMGAIDWIAAALLIIGGLNWGLIGAFQFDLVASLFGAMSQMSRVVYALVGLAALYFIYTATKLGGHKYV